jgi:hypothetical protein
MITGSVTTKAAECETSFLIPILQLHEAQKTCHTSARCMPITLMLGYCPGLPRKPYVTLRIKVRIHRKWVTWCSTSMP